MEAEPEAELAWSRETIPRVMKIVCTRLPQRELVSLLLVSPWLHRTLVSYPSLWLVLDLREMTNVGNRLLDALSLARYRQVKRINLEFAQDIEDKHLESLKDKYSESLKSLESLNLNGCQKISDKGIAAVTSCCPNLKVLSIYWNVRVTDIGIKHLVENCRHLVDLNLSGCKVVGPKSEFVLGTSLKSCAGVYDCNSTKIFDLRMSFIRDSFFACGCLHLLRNDTDFIHLASLLSAFQNITDRGLELIADSYKELQSLNITRCIKLTDIGLRQILFKCSSLQSLNLYALSSLTDNTYTNISSLSYLKYLDLCGAQNLSDDALSCIAKCRNLVALNLTWCVRITDKGVMAVAEACISLEFLSLFGILGVTDKCLEALSTTCSNTLTTLDVNGCVGIKRRSREDLLKLFPHLKCFKVHS